MISTSTSAHPTSLDALTRVHRRLAFASPTQMLWDKLEQHASVYLMCRARPDLTDWDRTILDQCEAKLELARACFNGTRKRIFSFWDIIHEIDELLLLVIPYEMLPSRGLEILESFKTKVHDQTQRRLWLGQDKDEATGPLPTTVRWLISGSDTARFQPAGSTPVDLSPLSCRHALKGALGVVNYQTNIGFWQLSMNVQIQILSGLLLILLLVGLSVLVVRVEGWHLPHFELWEVLVFGLLGVAGATLANMLSKDRFTVVLGATTRWYVYYLFVKPLIGGFAALFVFLLEGARFLLAVTVGPDDAARDSLVQINVENTLEAFLVRAVLAIVAGAFADRVLSSTMESVLSKMFLKSEKTASGPPQPIKTT